MPTNNPRVNVVLEPPLFRLLKELAERDEISISMKVRDLVREALELTEDAYWTKVAKKRKSSFNRKTALSHKEVWR